MNQYNIPKETTFAEVEVKRSRFLVEVRHITSLDQMRDFYLEKRAEHPKANHNCWGVIAGSPNNSNLYGFSDDGEPSGCAGKPILNVMSHSGLGQIGLVVTRYFGGIKLGTGGMVKAYTEAAKAGIDSVIHEEFAALKNITLTFAYDQEPSVRHFIDNFDSKIDTNYSYSENVSLELLLKESLVETLTSDINERFGISVSVRI